jgi:catechol-2,3-dioxygenase
MVADIFDEPGTRVSPPTKLAHVVLRTGTNFSRMVDFYKTFLGAKASFENDFISFICYDDEHHRIAIVAARGCGPKVPNSSGLHHIAFSYDSLTTLAVAYRQRKKLGIMPVWSVNHGPTSSIYYRDPDGNMIETQVDNFSTSEEATTFMMSKEFMDDPFGTDFDPEELIERLRAGESDASIKRRKEVGPRTEPPAVLLRQHHI